MKNQREILIRYLEGGLKGGELEAFERRMAGDEALMDEVRRMQEMTGVLSLSRVDSFGPFFVDRTLKAIRAVGGGQITSLYDSLQWVFVRTALAALALVVVLSVLNVLEYQSLGVASTWIEAAFGLPSTTIEDAFSYGLI